MVTVTERVDVNRWTPPWLRHQHVTRYDWAAQFVRGKVVADAASGTGYGCGVLFTAGADRVDGFDLSADAVRVAQEQYPAAGIHFHTADVCHLPVPDGTYDVYVSFETIEHVPNADGYLAEAKRVLRPGGLFICSTPNRHVTNPGTRPEQAPYNRFHIREYTADELRTDLSTHFPTVELWGQTLYRGWYAAMLRRLGRVWPMMAVRAHQFRKVLGIPFENSRRHEPLPQDKWGRSAPEGLTAVCRNAGDLHEPHDPTQPQPDRR